MLLLQCDEDTSALGRLFLAFEAGWTFVIVLTNRTEVSLVVWGWGISNTASAWLSLSRHGAWATVISPAILKPPCWGHHTGIERDATEAPALLAPSCLSLSGLDSSGEAFEMTPTLPAIWLQPHESPPNSNHTAEPLLNSHPTETVRNNKGSVLF